LTFYVDFFENLINHVNSVAAIDSVVLDYCAENLGAHFYVSFLRYLVSFFKFQGHEVQKWSRQKSFFEIFFFLDLGWKKAYIELSAYIIRTFDHKNKINTTNTVQLIGSSISSFWQVQVHLSDRWWYLWPRKTTMLEQ
jgi:hypothetical protein